MATFVINVILSYIYLFRLTAIEKKIKCKFALIAVVRSPLLLFALIFSTIDSAPEYCSKRQYFYVNLCAQICKFHVVTHSSLVRFARKRCRGKTCARVVPIDESSDIKVAYLRWYRPTDILTHLQEA